MGVRVEVDYNGHTYRSAPIDGTTFAEMCDLFDESIKQLSHIRLDLDDGSRLYLAEQAASRAVIRVVRE